MWVSFSEGCLFFAHQCVEDYQNFSKTLLSQFSTDRDAPANPAILFWTNLKILEYKC